MKTISNKSILISLTVLSLLTSCASNQIAGNKAVSYQTPAPRLVETRVEEAVIKSNDLNTPNDEGASKADPEAQPSLTVYNSPVADPAPAVLIAPPLNSDEMIERELARIMKEFGEESANVPDVFHSEVKSYIKLYQTSDSYRGFVNRTMKRSAQYMPMIKGRLGAKGIPGDMAYIAFIESGFNPDAVSRSGAVGLWQFMKGTAGDYGLKVGRWSDDRRDPVKATAAATEYFQDLLSIFGPRSFLLAMAAYNAGEGRVMGCLKRLDNPMLERSFWNIRPCLSKETREYPPKIIAAAIIGNSPQYFGFKVYEDQPAVYLAQKAAPAKAKARPASIRKSTPAAVSKAPERTAKPAYKPDAFIYKVRKGNTVVKIAKLFKVKKKDILKWNRMRNYRVYAGQNLKLYPGGSVSKTLYKVRRGDTITQIARKHNVKPDEVMLVNGIRNSRNLQAGDMLTIYTMGKARPLMYTVKKGANLTYVARAFKVSVSEIMQWNGLKSSRIYPGQELKIYPKGSRSI